MTSSSARGGATASALIRAARAERLARGIGTIPLVILDDRRAEAVADEEEAAEAALLHEVHRRAHLLHGGLELRAAEALARVHAVVAHRRVALLGEQATEEHRR